MIPCDVCGYIVRADGVGSAGHKKSKKHLDALAERGETKEIIKVEKPIPVKVESVEEPQIPVRQEPVIIHETKPLETKPDEPAEQKSEKESKEDGWNGYYC